MLKQFILFSMLTALTACGSTMQQSIIHTPHIQKAAVVEEVSNYDQSTIMIEDLLGNHPSILGDMQDHAIAWKEQASGLIAFVEYKDGCIRKAYLTDADGNILSADDNYKRCEV